MKQAELAGLKKQLGLSAGDADHTQFQTTAGSSGLQLSEYFEWAEVCFLSGHAIVHSGFGTALEKDDCIGAFIYALSCTFAGWG